MVDAEVDPKGFVLVGDSIPLSYNFDDIIRHVQVEQRKRKAKEPEVMLLRWKEEEKEVEEEEKIDDEELKDIFYDINNFDPANDYDDDDDQGSTGLLIVNPSVQRKIDDCLNDEINEQEEDHHQESSSEKKHADRVFLTQPTVIYLNAPVEGQIEVPRSRAEILEELGLDDGKFKFDIEDEIPSSPKKEYEFKGIRFIG
ncbi:hypothetical protein Hanom_Chr13g01198831 [Helianthus anomalus]